MMEQSNRGKRSVGIDIGNPAGRELAPSRWSRPPTSSSPTSCPRRAASSRSTSRTSARVNPKIIYARGHGQGVRGPDVEKGGYDAASFWSRGGIAHALTPPGAAAPDHAARRLRRLGRRHDDRRAASRRRSSSRERTGEPSVVDVSLLGTAMWILAPDIVHDAGSPTRRCRRFDRDRGAEPDRQQLPHEGRALDLPEHAAARPLLGRPLPAPRPRGHDHRSALRERHGALQEPRRRASPSSTTSSRRARSPSGAARSPRRGRVGADADAPARWATIRRRSRTATCPRSTAATARRSRWSRARCSSTRRRPRSGPRPTGPAHRGGPARARH